MLFRSSDITVTGSFAIDAEGKLADNVYIAFIPNAATVGQPLTITAKVGDDTYELVKASTPAFKQGRVYPVGGEMTKVADNVFTGTFASFKTALPSGSTIVITDETVESLVNTSSDPLTYGNFIKEVVNVNISVVYPNINSLVYNFIYKAYGVISVSCPKLVSCGDQFARGEKDKAMTTKTVYLPSLKSAGKTFLASCGSNLVTLTIGTLHNESLTLGSSLLGDGSSMPTNLTNTTLYINATEYATVTGTTWRTKECKESNP